jgi:hypothetical protein
VTGALAPVTSRAGQAKGIFAVSLGEAFQLSAFCLLFLFPPVGFGWGFCMLS